MHPEITPSSNFYQTRYTTVLSARQAADYARFLQQVPWYKWDFSGDAADLKAVKSDVLRDRERRFALGLEYRVKAAYAGVIEAAVANLGADQLRIRSLVTGLSASELAAIVDVTVIAEHPEGVEIETPRYRQFTGILARIASQGGDLVEIAGNDDIMMTVLSDQETAPGAVFSFKRQGYGDFRHLVALKVADLGLRLRDLETSAERLEHIHDY